MFGIAENHEFLAAIGIDNAPNRDAIVAQIESIAQQRLIIRLSEKLTPAQLDELNSITDEKQVPNWLAANIPDFYDLVTEIFTEIKNELLAVKAEACDQSSDDIGIEKGEIITLSDNKEYLCLGIINDNQKKFLYFMTTTEPIDFCFAEAINVGQALQLRIVGSKEERLRLFELFKAQTKADQK